MNEPTLEEKIAVCDIEVINFITALKKENKKLQLKIAQLQAELVTERNRVGPLEHELRSLSENELHERLKTLRSTEK